jgi:hypothetical protein
LGFLFNAHVFQFAGLEDLAALQAFHKLGVFIAAYDLHTRVLAGLRAGVWRWRERPEIHKSGSAAP